MIYDKRLLKLFHQGSLIDIPLRYNRILNEAKMMFVQLRFTLQFLRKQEVGWQCLSVSVDAADHGHVLACRCLFCTRYPPFSAYHAIAKSYRACI